MDQQEILHELCTAAENVFSTMLGLEVKAQEPVTEAAVPGPTRDASTPGCAPASCGLYSLYEGLTRHEQGTYGNDINKRPLERF